MGLPVSEFRNAAPSIACGGASYISLQETTTIRKPIKYKKRFIQYAF
jgi:hypothetical protein